MSWNRDTSRDLSLRELCDLSFGFFGVQIAYALQSANISRIFATLGADPHNLSYFWILPPLAGMIVQPLVGALSDRTWTRLGRRLPYLMLGASVAVIIMCLLPNSGSFGLTLAGAMAFGLVTLMLLDTSINMAMQPFKMLVGDMVSERQKTKAYSIQSFLCNAGSLVGFVCPFALTWFGVSNVAADGEVPDSVVYSFYGGAVVLMLCVAYTLDRVVEMPPEEYDRFHNIERSPYDAKPRHAGLLQLLREAPLAFWSVGIVQFFCWAAFMYMWTYLTGAVSANAFGSTDPTSEAFQHAGNWTGILFAVQAVGSLLWALVIPRFGSTLVAYSISLLIGALGFMSIYFVHDQYLLMVSLFFVGPAWAAMLALPFTLLTNALEGTPNMGSYLGLFNCSICLPQIVAAAAGGSLLALVGGSQPAMMIVAGGLLIFGAISVLMIRTK